MRYKPKHKEETHQRIVDAASKEFRAHGFEGVGIAKLMRALGLTHGGFYAHFADKEDLVDEALAFAMDQSLENMLSALKAGGYPAMFEYYLSEMHRDHPAFGCPLPALAAEVSRRPPSSRGAFTKKLVEIQNDLAERIPGKTPERRLEKASVVLASMAGAVSLARAVSDPVLSQSILRSTQEHLLRLIEAADD
ncbi:TetR family transcriptional regulator [Capsulimonas corticalis]|uniref:TetR family transcriptional regulator n=1 Tax=Capsulimonas corticalis TaxID=2219043 RepID=A0A402D766_9BACT|nr:TetR/AcrR family transcriptional regulator [Capsulimonas corticalis]BDI29120.1 TetR family transcriptional regulator [Capsulimonas corticalis]